jgi:hypothetical protein
MAGVQLVKPFHPSAGVPNFPSTPADERCPTPKLALPEKMELPLPIGWVAEIR